MNTDLNLIIEEKIFGKKIKNGKVETSCKYLGQDRKSYRNAHPYTTDMHWAQSLMDYMVHEKGYQYEITMSSQGYEVMAHQGISRSMLWIEEVISNSFPLAIVKATIAAEGLYSE